MILPGCLSVIFLPVVAALLGQWLGGPTWAMWGAGGGLIAGILVASGLLWAVRHVKKHG